MYHFVLLHGYMGTSQSIFLPWLTKELEKLGHSVSVPSLPHTKNPVEKEQVEYVLKHEKLDEKTVLFGHSLGAIVALKVLEKMDVCLAGLILAGGFTEPDFKDRKRPFTDQFDWHFDFEIIKKRAKVRKVIHDVGDYAIPKEEAELLQQKLEAELYMVKAEKPHFMNIEEPTLLQHILP